MIQTPYKGGVIARVARAHTKDSRKEREIMMTTRQIRKSCEDNEDRIIGVYDDGKYKTVACLGRIGDWAAYEGRSTETDEHVQRTGQKIWDGRAFELFPWLNPKAWRA